MRWSLRLQNFFLFVFFGYVSYLGFYSRNRWFAMTTNILMNLERLLILFGVPQICIKMTAAQTNYNFYKTNLPFFEKYLTKDEIKKIDFYSYWWNFVYVYKFIILTCIKWSGANKIKFPTVITKLSIRSSMGSLLIEIIHRKEIHQWFRKSKCHHLRVYSLSKSLSLDHFFTPSFLSLDNTNIRLLLSVLHKILWYACRRA